MTGFDDIVSLRDITPALTTVSLPLDAIGRAAIALAFDDKADRSTRVSVKGSVILPESTPSRDGAASVATPR
jgi:LacI family transcriptional regulator